jgi:hypothetical protein
MVIFYCFVKFLVINVDGGSMIEYSEIRKLSEQIKRKIIYYSFNNLHPDQLLRETLDNFGLKGKASIDETKDEPMQE